MMKIDRYERRLFKLLQNLINSVIEMINFESWNKTLSLNAFFCK